MIFYSQNGFCSHFHNLICLGRILHEVQQCTQKNSTNLTNIHICDKQDVHNLSIISKDKIKGLDAGVLNIALPYTSH